MTKSLKLVLSDPYLKPYEAAIQGRYDYAANKELELTAGMPLKDFADGYLYI